MTPRSSSLNRSSMTHSGMARANAFSLQRDAGWDEPAGGARGRYRTSASRARAGRRGEQSQSRRQPPQLGPVETPRIVRETVAAVKHFPTPGVRTDEQTG